MKFTKNIGFDIQNGILKNKDLFLCPIFIAIITFVNFRNQVKQLEVLHMLNPNSVSFADYWFFSLWRDEGIYSFTRESFSFPCCLDFAVCYSGISGIKLSG